MEENIQKSSFSFEGYKILKSSFEKKENPEGKEITLGFNPKGKIYKSQSKFELEIEFNAKDENDSFEVNIKATAFYTFKNVHFENNEISSIFLVNAPAILFPYIRAYISTLTALSGISPVLLPTVNLTGMKDALMSSIVFVD